MAKWTQRPSQKQIENESAEWGGGTEEVATSSEEA